MEMFSSNFKILMECLVDAIIATIHFRDTIQLTSKHSWPRMHKAVIGDVGPK